MWLINKLNRFSSRTAYLFIFLFERLKCTNNNFYFNLLFTKALYQHCKKSISDNHHRLSIFCDLLLGNLHGCSFDDLMALIDQLSTKDKEKFAKLYMILDPNVGLSLLEHINPSNDFIVFYRAYLYPEKKHEEILSRIIKKNPRAIFNFYNLVHINGNKNAKEVLNHYFTQKNIAPLAKKNNNLPLYVDNLCSQFKPSKINNWGKVSIIMCAHNEQNLIASSTESLINQTYKNIEIILIDDASTDKTQELFIATCRQFSFHHFTIIPLAARKGPFYCHNLGLQKAAGDFITFHGADDWAHPQRIEKQTAAIATTWNTVASMSHYIRIDANGQLFSKLIYPMSHLCDSSLLFKRKVFNKLGYFHTDLLGSDTEYFQRIKQYYGNNSLKILPLVLTIAAYRKNSRTTSYHYGVAKFGINQRRVSDYEKLMLRLYQTFKKKRKYFVDFSFDQYSV